MLLSEKFHEELTLAGRKKKHFLYVPDDNKIKLTATAYTKNNL